MPRKPNPRNQGKSGKELDRYKYNWLLDKGFTPAQAQEYRRAGWPKIDKALELKKQGLSLSEKTYYKRKTKRKAPKKEIKQRAKEKILGILEYPTPPEGFYYAYYKKTGKFVLKKKPGPRKTKGPGGGVLKSQIKHMVFIKDQTDEVNNDDFMQMQFEHIRKNNDELKAIIKKYLYKKEGAIGRVQSYLIQSPTEEEAFLQQYSAWALILDEHPGYHEVLAVLATVAQGVYEPWRKQQYAQKIIFQVEEYSKRIYNKLTADKFV